MNVTGAAKCELDHARANYAHALAGAQQAFGDKVAPLVALQRKANADKRLSVFFWNYPPGEKNLSASFLNVPRSLEQVSGGLAQSNRALPSRVSEITNDPLRR